MEDKVDTVAEAEDIVQEAVRDAGYPWMNIEIESTTFEAENRHGDKEKPCVHVYAEVDEDITNYNTIQEAFSFSPKDGSMVVKFSFDLPADHFE